jgi:Co/Zn/Cd efflux system component
MNYVINIQKIFIGSPKDVDFNVVQDAFLSVEGIVAVHNLRIWGLTTDKTALSCHLAVGELILLIF